MSDDLAWDAILEGLRTGDGDSCRLFWQQYGASLEAIAAQQLSGRLRRRVGADDIVQSVFRTFFRRISSGQFDLPDSDSLWRLMCAITLTKARRAARHHHQKKRGLGVEHSLSAGEGMQLNPAQDWGVREFVDESQLDIDLADELQSLLRQLGEEECMVLELKMNNLDNEQVAAKLGCSERTVRRLVKNIQDRWESMIDKLNQ